MKALRAAEPDWTCQQLSPTSSQAEQANAAANAAGNQFGGGTVSFNPGQARAGGDPYAEFTCSTSQGRQFIWYQEVGGVWVSMNGGLPASAVGSGGSAGNGEATSTDLYASCSNTIASYHDTVNGLITFGSTHSNRNALYKDFTALGHDLGIMGQQATAKGQSNAATALEEGYGIYTADAVSIQHTDVLGTVPADLAAVLQASCPHSWSSAGLPNAGATNGDASTTGSTRNAGTGNTESTGTETTGSPGVGPTTSCPASTAGTPNYIRNLTIATSRTDDTAQCFVAGFVAKGAVVAHTPTLDLSGNYYTQGTWSISYAALPHARNQARTRYTVTQRSGLGTPLGHTVVAFVTQTGAN